MADKIILIGSTHGYINDSFKQIEIIFKEKPEFVLSEELENLKLDSPDKFIKLMKEEKISNMTDFKDVVNLVKLCYNKDINLIGIDYKNYGFNKKLQNVVKNKVMAAKKDENDIMKIIDKRERKHLREIKKYSKLTRKPLVVIVGSWHLRDDSLLRKGLQTYEIITPCNADKIPLFEPIIEKENVEYIGIKP